MEIARAYHPGWTVRVDGAPVELSPAPITALLRFPVSSGDHEVEVRWGRSPARRTGEVVSLIAMLAAMLVAAAAVRRR